MTSAERVERNRTIVKDFVSGPVPRELELAYQDWLLTSVIFRHRRRLAKYRHVLLTPPPSFGKKLRRKPSGPSLDPHRLAKATQSLKNRTAKIKAATSKETTE